MCVCVYVLMIAEAKVRLSEFIGTNLMDAITGRESTLNVTRHVFQIKSQNNWILYTSVCN